MPHIACPWTRRLSQLRSVVAEMDASIESMQVMRQQKLDSGQSDKANHIKSQISDIYQRVGRKKMLLDDSAVLFKCVCVVCVVLCCVSVCVRAFVLLCVCNIQKLIMSHKISGSRH